MIATFPLSLPETAFFPLSTCAHAAHECNQLLKRDPGARADVDNLLEEHISIGLAGQKFDRLLRTSSVDSVDLRDQLGTSGLGYIRALREHMLKEERKLFPLVKVILTKEDWQVIDKEVDAIEDPLFGAAIADEYQRLYRLITDQTELNAVTESSDTRD